MYTYRKHVLDNGLRVVSIQMPYLHSVLISIFVKVGPRFERDEERGLSHFLEHVLLNGTEHYPSSHELVEAVENIGGELNGLTSYEYGLYWLRTHHDHFDTGMRIFADIFNAPLFDATEIEGERQIILEEVHGYSQEGLGYLLLDLLWPQCAHKFNTLGDIENVEEFTQQDLMEHFRRFYVPQNMMLCMAGNFDAEQAEDLAAALFHDLCGEPDLAAEELGDPLPGPRWTSRPYGGTQTNFMLTHRAFSYRHPDRTRLQVFNTLLGIGTGSVLFETVREKLGLT